MDRAYRHLRLARDRSWVRFLTEESCYHARMEWIFGSIIVVVLILFLWASITASKTAQPFIDDVLDSHPSNHNDKIERE